jgi:putative ABC transport system ATP-binding protein
MTGVSTAPVLKLEGVSKYYRQTRGAAVPALRQVSLEVDAGRKVAITGRSGSGKSTLLHLAAGIDEPSEGEVSVLGANLARLSERQRTLKRRQEIGLIFQFFHLLPHLKVLENVLLPAWIAGDRGESYAGRAEDLLARVGLADRAQDPVHGLSGGEMQRVAICRALLRQPPLLLADEPTGNLDDENARVVMELFFRLVEEERSTLLYVTHSTEMTALADETFVLHSGRLSRA